MTQKLYAFGDSENPKFYIFGDSDTFITSELNVIRGIFHFTSSVIQSDSEYLHFTFSFTQVISA